MSIKDNIKCRRDQLNMTLEDVGRIVGVTRQTVQKYESGIVSNIPSDKIELLAKALKTTPSFLMGWEDTGNNATAATLVTACTPAGQRIGHLYDKADSRDKQVVETVLEPYDDGEPIVPVEQPLIVQFPKTTKRKDGFTEIKIYDQPAAAGLGNYLDEPDHHLEQYPSFMIPERVDFGIKISGNSMEPLVKDGSTVFVHACVSIDPGKIGIFILNGAAYCKKLAVDREKRQIRLVSINKAYSDIEINECDDFRTVGLVL